MINYFGDKIFIYDIEPQRKKTCLKTQIKMFHCIMYLVIGDFFLRMHNARLTLAYDKLSNALTQYVRNLLVILYFSVF